MFRCVFAESPGVSLGAFTIFAHGLAARYSGLLWPRQGVPCNPQDVIDAVLADSVERASVVTEYDLRQVCNRHPIPCVLLARSSSCLRGFPRLRRWWVCLLNNTMKSSSVRCAGFRMGLQRPARCVLVTELTLLSPPDVLSVFTQLTVDDYRPMFEDGVERDAAP